MKTFKTMTLILLAMCFVGTMQAQTLVNGTVLNAAKEPVAGATVIAYVGEKAAPGGTITDTLGKFTITVPKEGHLRIFFIGYETAIVRDLSPNPVIVLNAEKTELEEVVVVGYGTQEIISLTGSASVIQPSRRRSRAQAASVPMQAGLQVTHQVAALSFDYDAQNAEEYAGIRENRFVAVEKDPLSTFSLEVDGASYANVRRMINDGQLPPADAIRIEELVNYFSYDYEKPTGNDPLKIGAEIADCPWNPQHRLVRIGVKAREIDSDNLPASNFVFLIDVSGSMYGPTRLELVKSSLKLLVNNLREEDRVSIVVYAGAAGVVLPATSGSDKQKIREALDKLTAGGSTAGGAGIQLAYKLARQNFITGGNNRIILCTDGDFNVGVSSNEGLEHLVEQERKSGVFLTVLGYGMGNYKDAKMQTLAEKGNGNHAYIDNIQEANRVLVSEFGGTMHAVAKDVKLQLEFNPAQVQAYRLVGYESRLLAHEDFNDDTKDAGELGAGHSVTAFYEVIPTGIRSHAVPGVDPLKYQPEAPTDFASRYSRSPDLLTVKLRYKAPDGDVSRKMEVAVIDDGRGTASDDFSFAASVAMFGQLLRSSDFKGTATYDDVITLARKGLSKDEHGYRREFVRIVESVKGMAR
jgi:Ca-activated chloride channel family protein